MGEQTITILDVGTDEELSLFQDSAGRLYVDDERVWSVSALGDGIVALTTGIRTVHIGAADYWRALHGEDGPSVHRAGILAARVAHLEDRTAALIAAIAHEPRITPAAYPAIWERIKELRTALGSVADTASARV